MRAGEKVDLRVLTGVVLAMIVSSPIMAAAQGKGPQLATTSVIPAGEDWFCWGATNAYNSSDTTSGCTRTLEACKSELEGFVNNTDVEVNHDECVVQKKAAVYTYFSVMHDQAQVQLYRSMSDCKRGRVLRLEQPDDYKRVSGCSVIGSLAPSKLRRSLIPRGRGWHCRGVKTRSGQTGFTGDSCFRDRARCEEAIAGQVADLFNEPEETVPQVCLQWDDAWAYSVGSELFVSSKALCNMRRPAHASRCESVK